MKTMGIIRRAVSALVILAGVTLGAGLVAAQAGQADDEASVQLEAAIQKQFVTGDLVAAINRYQAILTKYGSQNPKVAAQALWRLAQCQEKLGRLEDARQSYERLVREHSSQTALTTAGRARLSAIVEDEEWDESDARRVVEPDYASYSKEALAQLWGNSRFAVFNDLSVFNQQTGESRRLLTGSRSATFPVMSRNGQLVAYFSPTDLKSDLGPDDGSSRSRRETGELRVVSLDGSNDRSLVRSSDIRWIRPFQWSPDNRSIIAFVERTSALRQIVSVSATTGSMQVLKSSPWLSVQEMNFSEDGRFMTYQASTPRDSQQFDFYVLRAGERSGPAVDRRYTVSLAAQRGIRVSEDELAVHVLNRLGYGPRQGDVERVRSMGIDAYIAQQLHPEKIADSVTDEKLAPFHGLKMSIPELLDKAGPPLDIVARRASTIFDRPEMATRAAAARKAAAASSGPRASVDPLLRITDDRPPDMEIWTAKIIRAVHSERQLQEVLVDFWMNHFNVALGATEQTATHFEEQAIRRHVFGRFEDMLSAVAHHPRMLFYLDNWRSSAPTDVINARITDLKRSADVDAQVALLKRMPFLKESKGINENYGRELLELHTLGVDGGYTQQDVVEVAKILTGWTISTEGVVNGRDEDGVFVFDPLMHVTGDKVVLGQTIKGGGVEEGEQLLKILARHPSTARLISTKLARRFIADDPPRAVIDAASRTFLATNGDLREVVRTILTSPQFRSGDAVRTKIKKPFELVVSALRALDAKFEKLDTYAEFFGNRSYISRMGEKVYNHEAPDGHPDVAPAWMNSNALMLRLEFANKLATEKVVGVKVDLASAERLLTQMSVPRPTPLQVEQTRAMLQAANSPAPTMMGQQNQMMMGAAAAAAKESAAVDPAAITVAAMLGSPQFQKR